jgi:serine protease Do
MHVGDTVYAVGNPLGELAYTMTRGMISALDRDITTQDSSTGESKTVNMFQFDAAVNNGNSGGP